MPGALNFVAESLLQLKMIYLPGIPWTNLLVRNYMIFLVVIDTEIIMELQMPPFPDQGMWMLPIPMGPTLPSMLLMMEEIPMNRGGWPMEINYLMSGFPMISECQPKSMPTRFNRKVGDMQKEHQRIGLCKLPTTT